MVNLTISRPVLNLSSGGWPRRQNLTPWQQFWKSPLKYLSETLYIWRPVPRQAAPIKDPIRVVCISDTHNLQPDLPDGDVLLHAGDLTGNGFFQPLQAQLDWLNKQKHRY